jgi:hypothetical protein
MILSALICMIIYSRGLLQGRAAHQASCSKQQESHGGTTSAFDQLVVKPLTESLDFRPREWRKKVIDADICL